MELPIVGGPTEESGEGTSHGTPMLVNLSCVSFACVAESTAGTCMQCQGQFASRGSPTLAVSASRAGLLIFPIMFFWLCWVLCQAYLPRGRAGRCGRIEF